MSNNVLIYGTKKLISIATDFLLPAKSARLFLRTFALPSTPTDGVARNLSLTPLQRRGFELPLAPLHLFNGPKFRMLCLLSYCGCSSTATDIEPPFEAFCGVVPGY